MSSLARPDDIAMVNAILYRYDPIGIAIPEDEYLTEARMIAGRMRLAASKTALLDLIYQTFCLLQWNHG